MVKCEDVYSFRLSTDDSVYSDTGSVTSSYKARIDSLFRDRRNGYQEQRGSPRSLVTTVQVHSDPSTKASSSVEEQPLAVKNNQNNITSIRVQSPQTWKAKAPSASEELESIFGGKDRRQQAFHNTRSAVQAQIERLFADAAADPSVPGVRAIAPKLPTLPVPPPPPPPIAPPLPPSSLNNPVSTSPKSSLSPRDDSPVPSPPTSPQSIPESSLAPSVSPSDFQSLSSASSSPASSRQESLTRRAVKNMKYAVNYLGAIQLADKATSLEVLQEPLKELYYKFRYSVSRGRPPTPGSLHITEKGIRIVHGTRDDLLNPFPTIAVWAAVKLVIRREVGEHGQMFFSYAFLPLICDPEAQDKYNLYHELNVGNPNVMAGEHPPMFACVMRKEGIPRILECHGFVCRSAEDAIVIAANLYQSLLESMRGGHSSDSSGDPRDDERHVMSDSETTPIRPPRRKRSRCHDVGPPGSRKLKRSSSEDFLSTHAPSNENRVSKRRIRRSISDRHSINNLEDYDPYMKVAIPRSKSFINVTNKYDFQDLLDDVKKQTGLNSVDDVLKQIISPKGMSFSEMDPKYRELLLKLALTLSKDEIYQRSKNIMRKYKYRTTSIASIIDSDSDASTISSVIKATKRSFSRLGSRASSLHTANAKDKNLIKKLQSGKSRLSISEPISRLAQNELIEKSDLKSTDIKRVVPKTPMPKRVPGRISEGYVSCSECGYESGCSSKCYCSLPRPMQPRPSTLPTKKVFHKSKEKRGDLPCECDTESCAESEKCYCSLKGMRKTGLKAFDINLDSDSAHTDSDTTVKTEITASRGYGSESNSSQQHRNSSPYLTEHSKSRSAGTVFSMHPDVIRKRSYSTHLSSDSDSSERHRITRSSSRSRMSLMRQRSASSEFLSEKIPRLRRHPSGSVGSVGSSLDSPESPDFHRALSASRRSSVGSLQEARSTRSRSSTRSQQKFLLVSAVDPSGKVVYRGASQQKARPDCSSDTTSILSMKKTAEIAALFSELKLNQTTDLVNNHMQQSTSESDDDAYSSMKANSSSFLFSDNIETSLGYLP